MLRVSAGRSRRRNPALDFCSGCDPVGFVVVAGEGGMVVWLGRAISSLRMTPR
jgi:hypothetical protein